MQEFDKLVDIISQLREECPWDKEQTHESLSKHLIEEAYELLDSLAKLNNNNQESYRNLSSELGDLLLQILLHSKIASENGYFSIVEVVDSLNEKLMSSRVELLGKSKSSLGKSFTWSEFIANLILTKVSLILHQTSLNSEAMAFFLDSVLYLLEFAQFALLWQIL